MAVEPFTDTLRTIEAQVLDDVWIGPRRAVAGAFVASILVGTAGAWCWFGDIPVAHGIPVLGLVLFAVAGVVSGIALARRRYRWCCVAAYSCGLATVIGVGVLWWLRTGHHAAGLGWLAAADLAAVTLAGIWLTVVVTPIERSQPDMRTRGDR